MAARTPPVKSIRQKGFSLALPSLCLRRLGQARSVIGLRSAAGAVAPCSASLRLGKRSRIRALPSLVPRFIFAVAVPRLCVRSFAFVAARSIRFSLPASRSLRLRASASLRCYAHLRFAPLLPCCVASRGNCSVSRALMGVSSRISVREQPTLPSLTQQPYGVIRLVAPLVAPFCPSGCCWARSRWLVATLHGMCSRSWLAAHGRGACSPWGLRSANFRATLRAACLRARQRLAPTKKEPPQKQWLLTFRKMLNIYLTPPAPDTIGGAQLGARKYPCGEITKSQQSSILLIGRVFAINFAKPV